MAQEPENISLLRNERAKSRLRAPKQSSLLELRPTFVRYS